MKTMINQLFKTVAFQTVVSEKIQKETQNAQESPENVKTEGIAQKVEEASGDASVPAEESAGDSTTDGTIEGDTAADMTGTEAGEGDTATDMAETEAGEDGALDMQGEADGVDISGDMMAEDGMGDMMETQTGTQASGSVLASYPFVIGISAVTLVLSIVIGILLAKRKIKKGLDLYED
ncbi:MAG: hypothetical protein E7256_07020 [Lachnospiraceae bacterium]|nr:hypothetical protein [Lachnospiraceae bacterium]